MPVAHVIFLLYGYSIHSVPTECQLSAKRFMYIYLKEILKELFVMRGIPFILQVGKERLEEAALPRAPSGLRAGPSLCFIAQLVAPTITCSGVTCQVKLGMDHCGLYI